MNKFLVQFDLSYIRTSYTAPDTYTLCTNSCTHGHLAEFGKQLTFKKSYL